LSKTKKNVRTVGIIFLLFMTIFYGFASYWISRAINLVWFIDDDTTVVLTRSSKLFKLILYILSLITYQQIVLIFNHLDHLQWLFNFNNLQHPLFQFLKLHIIFSLLIQYSFNFNHSNGFSFNSLPHHLILLILIYFYIFVFIITYNYNYQL